MDNQQKAKEILAKYKIQGYVPASKQVVDINTRFAELDAAASGQTNQTGQQDGLLKSIAKDVAGTLVVNPIARATEAVTRLVAPNSLAAQGFEQLQAEGKGQDILGVNVPSVKAFGEGGGKQIVGEALKTASYLFPYGKVAQGVGGLALGASKLTPTAIAASKLAGNVASGATGGYLADVGMGLTGDETVGEALTPGTGTVIGAAIPLAGPALRATGRATSKIGSKIGELGIPTSSREAQILQTYKANNPFFKRVGDVLAGTEKAPQTAAKTAVEKGLIGTKSGIGVQSKRAAGTLWNDVISPRLKASDQAVDLDGFFNKIENDIVTSTPEISRQKALLNALNSFKDDYAGINSVSLEKLQKLKEGWAEFIPEKAYKGENIAGAANQVRKLMANESRQTIYSQLGDDVKQAYFDYGNLQGLQKLGQVSMTGAKLKGGAGSFISEIASQAVTPITTVGGQAVYRLGNGIEFIGKLGAKNLGEALGIQGGLKFPGDMAVDDIGKTIKNIKATPNKQGGFIKIGQDAKVPTTTQTSQTASKVKNTVISDTIPQKGLTGKGTIPENSLLQEAKKYKSAEEFVKAQGTPVYHGTTDTAIKSIDKSGFRPGKNGDWGSGIYLTKDKNSASLYGEKLDKSVIQASVPEKQIYNYSDFFNNKSEASLDLARKIIKNKSVPETLTNMSDVELAKRIQDTFSTENPKFWLEKAGYKGITDPERIISQVKDEVVIFDPSVIKTKSQLTDIWKKANKLPPNK